MREQFSKFKLAVCLGVMLASLASAPRAMAQAVYGSIFGTVTDSTGAVIPNATITVTDTAKGTSNNVTSNGSGEFTVDHLIPDTYDIKIASAGFKGYQAQGVLVQADTSRKVEAVLEIGGSDQVVNVSADSIPQLKTDRADVSTTFSSQEIVDLPIPDRNFTNLQLLLPGAQQLGWSHAPSENPQGSKQIEVDGQAFAGVAFQLDGTDNQDPILGIIVINPNSDSLSETKITTQNFDAEFGKAVSSVITAQTKSGSNSFHGSAFDYRESSYNLARDPFNQPAATGVPGAIKSQFGGSVGGPILKDKAFFFGDYQGVRQKVGTANTQTVPTQKLINSCLGGGGCDFSEYATALAGGGQLVYKNTLNADGTYTTTPYANNVIPASDLSAPALAVLKSLQPFAPNNNTGTFPGLVQNYSKSGNGLFNSNQWDVRGDYQFSERIHAFGRFSRFTDTLTGAVMFGDAGGAGFGLGGYGGTSQGANDSAAAGVDVAVNSKLVTDIRLGYFRYNIKTSKYDQGTAAGTALGIPGVNTSNSFTSGSPGFRIQDVGTSFGSLPSQDTGSQYGAGLNINRCNCPLAEREDQFQLANNWTKTIGNHSIKFGADLRYARNLRVPSDDDRTGELQFNSGPTALPGATGQSGLGFATFVTGKVTNFLRFVSTSTNAKEFQKRDFFYAQDTWRVSQKLTMNLGLRYEMYFPESINGPGNGSLLNLATGYLQVAGIGSVGSNMNYQRSTNTYNPRIGVAYQVTPQTVIRAGYGRSFDIGVFGSIFGHAATQNLPVLAAQQVTQVGNQGSAFLLQNGPPAPTPVAVPSNGLLPNPGNLVNSHSRPTTLRLPTLDAWNLSVQQSLSPTLSFTMAYVANKGTHTLGDQSGQQTNPNEAAITLPAQYSVNGQTLHYDPAAGNALPGPGQTATGNSIYLQRYYGGKLAACSDAAYTAAGGVNAPNGGCGWTNGIQYYGNDLDSHYNALQATITKTMAHGISLNANYAWQQAISEATGYSTWSRPAVRGRDGALRQQQVIVYGLFQLPMGKGKLLFGNANRIVNTIVGGIEINPVITYSSGLPFTLNYSTCSANLPGSAPCYVSGQKDSFKRHVTGFPGGPNGLSYYDKVNLTNGSTPFFIPGLDQIGNTGRNSEFGPRFFNGDLSIQKNFLIREKVTFQLRADGFNAFNHINFASPNGNIDQGGAITGGPYPNGSNPRQMQFSARVQF
ncbi:TonB-dependent receptor [Granulicella sibirica]|uniref:Oar protein n=1 Tax=Granulicella sibirica TaxID=2479048 RepID=A0A4Q0SXH6_9BACT|nr:TonB-dependent receptor [Granulicella sibirica]RXH54318.1 Oar protein [Granulicella sibirica]